MNCPHCKRKRFKVVYVINVPYKNSKIRRRECLGCSYRFTTCEVIKESRNAKQSIPKSA